jgi:hypothetical protein
MRRLEPTLSPNTQDLHAALAVAQQMLREGHPREDVVQYLTAALRALYESREKPTVNIP